MAIRQASKGAIAAVVLCTAMACGSTIQAGTTGAADLSVPTGQPTSAPGGVGTSGGTTTGSSATGGSLPGTGGSTTGGTGALPIGGGLPSAAPGALPPGASHAPLYLGVAYERNAKTSNAAVGGGSNSDPGDFKADYKVMFRYINKHGGIAGHPIRPVWYEFDVASSDTVQTQEQRACDTWTHDHHVFAILLGQSDIIKSCAARAGVVQLSVEESSTDGTGFARYPSLVEINAVGLDRVGPATVKGLTRMHYFDGVQSQQIGIVTWDLPQYHHAIDYGYLPALRKLGFQVSTKHLAFLTPPDTATDVALTSNAARAAALRFSQDGVNHVMILDGHAGLALGGLVHLEFMTNAEALHYRPRYGLNGTAAYANEGAPPPTGTYPPAQLKNSVGIGWEPGSDQNASDYPPSKYSPARTKCLSIFKRGGIVASDTTAEANMIGDCDELFFLKLVASRVIGALTTPSFMQAVAALGSLFKPAGTFATSFAHGRRDGASEAINVKFFDSCSCYRYVGRPFPI